MTELPVRQGAALCNHAAAGDARRIATYAHDLCLLHLQSAAAGYPEQQRGECCLSVAEIGDAASDEMSKSRRAWMIQGP